MIISFNRYINEKKLPDEMPSKFRSLIDSVAKHAVSNTQEWFPDGWEDDYRAEDDQQKREIISNFIDNYLELLSDSEKTDEKTFEIISTYQSELIQQILKIL